MRLILIFLLVLPALPPQFAFARTDESPRLEKVVVLSRHGIRAPTQPAAILELWSRKAWPVWPVEAGELTERGARLVTAMWENIREMLARERLLPDSACAEQKAVYVRADTDERTRATAFAILQGLGKDCRLGYHVYDGRLDPLFHPVKAGIYKYDAIRVARDVLSASYGGLERLQDEFSGALNLIGEITGPPASKLCARFALLPQCQLADLPNAISVSPAGDSVRVVGSLGIASSIAEIFLLEYGQWPDAPAGWGEVNQTVLAQTLPIHSRIFDVVNRAPLIAWANGSALLKEMGAALLSEHEDADINNASLVVFVGHDTNIANVGGILNFTWRVSGYPANSIPPAAALFLELWHEGGQPVVRARFFAQPPAVLHAAFREENVPSAYAPREALVMDGEGQKIARLPAAIFRERIRQLTKDGPQTPGGNTQLVYGTPVPNPAN